MPANIPTPLFLTAPTILCAVSTIFFHTSSFASVPSFGERTQSERTRSARSTSSSARVNGATSTAPLLVVLDPGHGGEDTGNIQVLHNRKVMEKDLSLQLAFKTKAALEARGIRTILTRTHDQTVSLDKRALIANQASLESKNTVFVSLHANSSHEKHSSGVETYVFNAATNDAAQRLATIENAKAHPATALELILTDLTTTGNYRDSVQLAAHIQKSVVSGLRTKSYPVRDRGVRRALFYILMQSQVPSVLFEPGFASNPEELTLLVDSKYQISLAEKLAEGIMRWRAR